MKLGKANLVELSPARRSYLRRKISHWHPDPPPHYPWRGEKDSYRCLVAEILLQRTRADQVAPVYTEFLKKYPSAQSLAEARIPEIRLAIRRLGLAWRAGYLKLLGQQLIGSFAGEVPEDITALQSLPGVGPYAASAFMSLHRGHFAPLIDSNTVRMYGRFFGFEVHAETRRKAALIDLVARITPRRNTQRFNYSALDLSRTVCKPVPECSECPLVRCCAMAGQSRGGRQ